MARRRPAASTTTPASPPDRRRKKRSRPTPRWLLRSREIDEIAKRRCLMLLTVLSGERPVTEVIEELGVSRGTYYQLEQKALEAMLGALMPGAAEQTSAAKPHRRIAELEQKVARLEAAKRRTERLLYLTRQLLKPGPVTTGVGRPSKRNPRKRSGKNGNVSSRRSTTKTTIKTAPIMEEVSTSILMPAGAAEP